MFRIVYNYYIMCDKRPPRQNQIRPTSTWLSV